VGRRRRGQSGWLWRRWEQGAEMTQTLYAHMNNKTIKILKKERKRKRHGARSTDNTEI
jgi:hypothetical protein